MSQGEGGGRPTKYRSEFCRTAKLLARGGATDFEIYQALGISRDTFYQWLHTHPKFSEAVKGSKAPADRRTERSLFERANGYIYPSEEIFLVDHTEERQDPASTAENPLPPIVVRTKVALRVPTLKHVPPDTTAIIFWLKNRRPKKWRDFKAVELSTLPGRPVALTYTPTGPQLLQDYHAKLAQSAVVATVAAGPDPRAPRDLGSDGQSGEEPDGDSDISGR